MKTRRMIGILALLAVGGWTAVALAETPVLHVETVALPYVSARPFHGGAGRNARGGWNAIVQYMNYKYTTGFTYERIPIEGTQNSYVAFREVDQRPPAEWVVIDLEAGNSRAFEWPGFHATASVTAENGRVFFGVDFLHILYYDPASAEVRMLGQIAEWVPFTNDRSFYRMLAGPDGMIYATTQSYNHCTAVLRLNPDTLEYKLIDKVGTGTRATKLTYGYYLAVDPPWAYVAVGQEEWELFAVNMDTGEKRLLGRCVGTGARIVVSDGRGEICSATLSAPYAEGETAPEGMLNKAGGHIVYTEKGSRESVWLVDGTAIPAVHEAGQPLPYTPMSKKTYARIEWLNTKPLPASPTPVVDQASLPPGPEGSGSIRWRPAGDEGDWRTAPFAIRHGEALEIEALSLLPDGSLLGNVKSYQGFFRYDPGTARIERYPQHGPSGVQSVLVDGKVYFAGYPNMVLWCYDPAQPWTSTGKGSAGDVSTNPHLITTFGQGTAEGHHMRRILDGGNGRLYLLGRRERWSTGSALGYYEIASGAKKGLPTDMKELNPQGMVVLPELGRVVVSGQVAEGEAQLRVYDLDLNDVERLTVKPGLKETGRLYAVPAAGRFIGILDRELYLFDLNAKQVVRSKELDDAVRGGIFTRPADGSLWLIVGDRLCRLDPDTLEPTPAGVFDGPLRALYLWHGEALYGTAGGELRRVAGF